MSYFTSLTVVVNIDLIYVAESKCGVVPMIIQFANPLKQTKITSNKKQKWQRRKRTLHCSNMIEHALIIQVTNTHSCDPHNSKLSMPSEPCSIQRKYLTPCKSSKSS